MSTLGNKIRELRRGIADGTIGEASAELGFSARALGSYERGQRMPGVDFLAKLAKLTDTDINALLRLRLEASGHTDAALQVAETPAQYQPAPAVASHARKRIMQAQGLPQYWQLGLMELAAAGEITAKGVDKLIGLIIEQDNV